jgi:hypothetical protein
VYPKRSALVFPGRDADGAEARLPFVSVGPVLRLATPAALLPPTVLDGLHARIPCPTPPLN